MKLIRHLPSRLAEIKELADIQEAIEPELIKIDDNLHQIILNRNPLYADIYGIELWEEWLKITPDPAKTLEQRRFDILAKLNEWLPFTLPQLHRMLAGIVGWENFTITNYPGEAKLDVEVDLSEREAAESIFDLLKRVVPAHIWWRYIKSHKQEAYPVRVKTASRIERIVETQPEIKVQRLMGTAYYNNAERIQVSVETD